MATKRLTELDFDGIKNNLKLYLQSQEEFSDYDFEASGLAVLIDLLAYNTHYNAVLAHMTANEAFLDSAVKRNSVASIAKTMGYTARSARAARATINLTIVPDPSYTSGSYTLSRNSIFRTTLNGKTLNFYPSQDYVATRETSNGVTGYFFTGIEIIEGLRVQNSEIIEAGSRSGPILMANPDVDTTTVRCRVQESLTDTNVVTYSYADDILNVTSTSEIFYIEEALNGFYQVAFGDGVIGKQPEVGNVIRLDYIATNAAAGNGATTFTAPSNLTGSGETVTLTVTSNSSGGAAQESVDSIRYNAPRFNATKNRAVTANDYKALIIQNNPNVKSVAVWGGEDNDPPIYGKVFISLQPEEGLIITQDDKDAILRDFIEPRQPVAIVAEFVDPEYTYIGMNANISYDAKKTTLTEGQIKTTVNTEIESYFNSVLNKLDSNFYYSKLAARIVNQSPSFVAVNLELKLQKRVAPTYNTALKYTFNFNNKVNPFALYSNYFTAKIGSASYEVYVADVPNSDVKAPSYNGQGKLVLKTVSRDIIVDANAGTIDYDTGQVILNNLNIVSLSGSSNVNFVISVQPHESAKDIKTEILSRTTETTASAVIPTPSRNIILALDQTSADAPNNVFAGVTITATPKIADY